MNAWNRQRACSAFTKLLKTIYVPALFEWETACLLLSFPSTYKFNTYINQFNRITEDTVIPNT